MNTNDNLDVVGMLNRISGSAGETEKGISAELRATPTEEKKKREIPPQIDNVEEELRKMGLALHEVLDKKDKEGKPIKTKNGKVARVFKPYPISRMRVAINEHGHRLWWWDEKCTDGWRACGITGKEYDSFLKTASVRKRLNLFLKYKTQFVIRKIKYDQRIQVRLTDEEYRFLQELSAKMGKRKVSELIRNRIRGTILHESLTPEEKANQKKLLTMADDMKQFSVALSNFLKTTGAKGAQRLDNIFNSQPGTDYAKVIFEAAKIIKRTIKYDNNGN